MIYEALFLPVTEEKERGGRATKRGEERRMESVKSEPKGKEDSVESVEQTYITLRPLG